MGFANITPFLASQKLVLHHRRRKPSLCAVGFHSIGLP
jgi:hypothetical protein